MLLTVLNYLNLKQMWIATTPLAEYQI